MSDDLSQLRCLARGFVWTTPGRRGEWWTKVTINGVEYDWGNVAVYNRFGELERLTGGLTMEDARDEMDSARPVAPAEENA